MKVSEETRKKMSDKKKKAWAEGKYKNRINGATTEEGRKKISNGVKFMWEEGRYSERVNGMINRTRELHHGWKPELHTPTCFAERKYIQFLSLFEDTNFCRRCGSRSAKINIHHIDENHSNFLISNLVPLCVPCHMSFHYENRKQPFITVGKRTSFEAAHYLPDYDGPCANVHGHSFYLDVEILKRIDPDTKMVVDFRLIKKDITEFVISQLDHKVLNDVIDNPTSENLLVWIWEALMFNGVKGLSKLTLWETENCRSSLTAEGMLSMFISNIEDYLPLDWKEKEQGSEREPHGN